MVFDSYKHTKIQCLHIHDGYEQSDYTLFNIFRVFFVSFLSQTKIDLRKINNIEIDYHILVNGTNFALLWVPIE